MLKNMGYNVFSKVWPVLYHICADGTSDAGIRSQRSSDFGTDMVPHVFHHAELPGSKISP
jgi:hypothetical protein